MRKVIYETGDEYPEVMGSGSDYRNVKRFSDEAKARQEYEEHRRDYLHRITYSSEGASPTVACWDSVNKRWS